MTLCTYAPLIACYLVLGVEDGYASQYGADVMIHTIEARIGWNHLPADVLDRYEVFGAVADCSKIGDEFWVNYNGVWEKGIVTDCAGNDGTPQWMEENRVVVEVDYETAVRWGIVGRGGIAVQMAYVHCEIAPGSMGPVAI